MASRAEVAESLDPFVELTKPVKAKELRDFFAKFVLEAWDARVLNAHHGTTNGTRYTFYSGSQREQPNRTAFEAVGRAVNWRDRTPLLNLTSIRTIDTQTAATPNYGGVWYNPMPTNVQFMRGEPKHYLWAAFQLKGEGVEAAQIVEPGTPQAGVLGRIASHLQLVVDPEN